MSWNNDPWPSVRQTSVLLPRSKVSDESRHGGQRVSLLWNSILFCYVFVVYYYYYYYKNLFPVVTYLAVYFLTPYSSYPDFLLNKTTKKYTVHVFSVTEKEKNLKKTFCICFFFVVTTWSTSMPNCNFQQFEIVDGASTSARASMPLAGKSFSRIPVRRLIAHFTMSVRAV